MRNCMLAAVISWVISKMHFMTLLLYTVQNSPRIQGRTTEMNDHILEMFLYKILSLLAGEWRIISLICHKSVTNKNIWLFRRNFERFFSAIIPMIAKTTKLLSRGEFYKLLYETIHVKSASANVSFNTKNSKIRNFEFWHSCHKWAREVSGFWIRIVITDEEKRFM